MKLITVAGLKAFAEIRDDHSDVLLGILVDDMSVRVQTYLNRNLELGTYTDYFEAGRGRRKYYLSAYPVILDSDLDNFILTDNGSVLTINDDFYLREDEGLLEFDLAPTFIVPKQIKAVYTGGYRVIDDSGIDNGSLNIPGDIKLATYLQCSYMFKRRNDLGLTSVSVSGGFSIGKMPAMALLPDVKSMLKNHRRVPGMY